MDYDDTEESKLRGLFRRSQGRSFLPGRKSYAPPSQTQTEFLPPLPPQSQRPQPERAETDKFIIGDRVCISGVKTGRLLYFGKFVLADGLWCGIELEEPVGKHDGEVQGVRYFSCKPGHGIFAPLEKVDLAPSTGSTQIPDPAPRVVRTKLQRRTLPAPKTYSQLSKDSNSDKGSLESLSSQSDAGSETTSLKYKSNLKPLESKPKESQLKKPKLSFLKKPSSIPKTGHAISPVEAVDTQENENRSGLTKPKSILSKGFGFESKLAGLRPKTNPNQHKKILLNSTQVLDSTQIIESRPDESCGELESKQGINVVNTTLVLESLGNVTQVLDDDLDSKDGISPASAGRSLEKRTQPDEKSYSEQDFKRARISQLQLCKSEGNQRLNTTIIKDPKLNSTFMSAPCDTTLPVVTSGSKANDTFDVSAEKNCEEEQAFSPEVHRQLVAGGKQYMNLTFEADQPYHALPDELSNIVSASTSAKSEDHEVSSELDSSLEFLKGDRLIGEATRLGILKPEEMDDTNLISGSLLERVGFETDLSVLQEENKHLDTTFNKENDTPGHLTGTFESHSDSQPIASVVEASSLDLLKSADYDIGDNTNFLVENPRLQELRLGDGRLVKSRHIHISSDFEEDKILAEGSDRTRLSSMGSDHFDLNTAVITSTPLVGSVKTIDTEVQDHVTPEECRAINISADQNTNLEDVRRNLDFTNHAIPNELDSENTKADPVPLASQNVTHTGSPVVSVHVDNIGLVGEDKAHESPTGRFDDKQSAEELTVEMQTSVGPSGLIKPKPMPMTDSGIDNVMTASQEMYASQTSEDRKSMPDRLDQVLAESYQLASDLQAGHTKTERPLSLISSISSVDTGYVPDTDSERGTLTRNSPTEWLEKQGVIMTGESGKNLTQLYLDTLDEQTAILQESELHGCVDTDLDGEGKADRPLTDFERSNMAPNPQNESLDNCTEGENSETESCTDVTEIRVARLLGDTQVVSETSQLDVSAELGEGSLETTPCEESEKESSTEKETSVKEENPEHEDSVEKSPADEKTDKDSKSKAKAKSSKVNIKVDHKKPNVNVGSKLAEYLKNPLPTKPREEGLETNSKAKKNLTNKKKTNLNKSKSDKDDEEVKPRRERVKVVKEPPKVIKRTTPKSKWGDIMSTIEASKDSPPKPKEKPVKSHLESIFSQPPPPKPQLKKVETVKKKLVTLPKPDYSQVKSRLNSGSPVTKSTPNTPRSRTDSNSSLGVVLHLDPSASINGSLNDSVQSICSSRSDLSALGHSESSVNRRKLSGKTSNNKTSGLSTKDRHPSAGTATVEDVSVNSVKAMNEKNIQKSPRRKAEIKSSIPPIAPLPRRSRSSPAKSSGKASEPSTSKQLAKAPTSVTKRSSSASSYQNRNKSLKSKGTKPSETDVEKKVKPSEEISRLEALCESRTKELTLLKMQLKSGLTAFDAMSALVNYLTQEMDAFSCPVIKGKLDTVQKELSETQTQLNALQEHKNNLEDEIVSLNKQHEAVLTSLNSEHADEMLKARNVLKEEHAAKIKKVEEKCSKEIDHLRSYHERHIKEIGFETDEQTNLLKLAHKEEIQCLQGKHDNQMEELHRQHKDSREDITMRFEGIKTSLLEKVETLKKECDELKKRARLSEEALLRDSDVKVQMALEPYKDLPREIESLKLVIEMRNDEIRDLRRQKIETDIQLKQLPEAKEKIIFLEQRVENLEAIVNIKTDHEKQLSDKCQRLLKKCDQENKQNKRLSMNVEELMWKMTESGSEFGSTESLGFKRQLSHSPPRHKSTSSSDTSFSPGMLRRNGQTVERRVKRRSHPFPSEDNSEHFSPNMSRSFNDSIPSTYETSFSEMSSGPPSLPHPSEPQVIPTQEYGQVNAEDIKVELQIEGQNGEAHPVENEGLNNTQDIVQSD